MDKYEYRLKAEQIEKLVKKQDYETAAKIADTIDWRPVKDIDLLYTVSEIYEKMERYEDCMEILNIAYDRAPVGRMMLYKMTELATKMHHFKEAIELYREFVRTAPHDQSKYILKYEIYHERGSSLDDQIRVLQEYKSHEYQEKWAYELASLYAQAGYTEECVRECDELILWFNEGEYVIKAMELKMQFQPLTAAQQEKYDHYHAAAEISGAIEDDLKEKNTEFGDKFSTMNLQAELAANLGEILQKEKDPTIQMPTLDVDAILGKTEKTEEAVPEESERMKTEDLPKIELEELAVPEETERMKTEDLPKIELEELAVPEESERMKTEDLPKIELEELAVPEEAERMKTGDLPKVELENLAVPQKQLTEDLPKIDFEELTVPEKVPEEKEAKEAQEEKAQGAQETQENKETQEAQGTQENQETPQEPMVEKQITGQMTIDDILAEWENKKAETEAILAAEADSAQERKEKVKQETADLMRLISGATGSLPDEVQHILDEIDEEKKQAEEPLVTEDDLPQDLNESEDEEGEISFENLDISDETVNRKKERVSQDTVSLSMIQELERSLSTEVSEKTVNEGHLTKDQAHVFSYFTSVKGMGKQLSVLFKGKEKKRTSSSRGNLVITGTQGNGKTTLAIDVVKAMQKQEMIEGKRLAKISGQKLNSKDVYEVIGKLKGGALIIENAGGLSEDCMVALSLAMEGDTGGMLFILEDTAEEIEKIFLKNKNFASKFDHTVDIPVFSNDELVSFGKSYALECGYVFDEFGILALYDRIGCRQNGDHTVNVAEVKEIIDGAISHAEKGSVRHLLSRLAKKNIDEYGNHLLREEDFEEV